MYCQLLFDLQERLEILENLAKHISHQDICLAF